ncbi:MAG: NUDIX hydrolase [Tetrasphaera sp.]|nr:NUDIX hydrolase [Tetrasphaera sp.]
MPSGPHVHPDVASEEGRLAFIRVLNERLPTKRTIGQGIIRNPEREVLLCELTYKRELDLPGGVLDPHESPAACVEREISEELGVQVRAGRLLAVNWLPPWRGWDDAVLFLFDCGTLEPGQLDPDRFLRREIKGVHWLSVAAAAPRLAPYAARMLEVATDAEHTTYLENSDPRAD